MNKKAIEMGFNVLFAIVVGIIILALAIYATTRIIGTGEKAVSTETAAKIISLLDPLETGLASGKSEEIKFKKQTRIFFDCKELENHPFGMQTIQFSEQTFGEKFGEKGGEVPIYNKYVFSRDTLEGDRLNIFSKAFSMPFKVADLIIINNNDYCFYQAPSEIIKDVENLNIQNIQFSDDLQNCSGVNVCFGSYNSECDIEVLGSCTDINCESEYDYGRVSIDFEDVYFVDSLLYAAIFSSKDNYECNIKRLMSKLNELGLIYLDKIKVIKIKGCSSTVDVGLSNLISLGKNLETSKDLLDLINLVESIDKVNQATTSPCRLY